MRTPKLLQQRSLPYQLCVCGHEWRLHLELNQDDPEYRPCEFVCRTCGCKQVKE